MKAVVLKETGKLAVEDVPKPRLGPDEVMLRVTDCGICGSDIRYLHGENPWAQHTLGEARTNPKNISYESYDIPGHEVAGVVEAVGERADKSLAYARSSASRSYDSYELTRRVIGAAGEKGISARILSTLAMARAGETRIITMAGWRNTSPSGPRTSSPCRIRRTPRLDPSRSAGGGDPCA